MQVQTGELRGMRLKVPKGNTVRPTSGRIKKSIFDTIGIIDENSIVLDIFSGSGSLGIEALSRGAKSATFIEQNRSVAKTLKENIANCGLEKKAKVLELDYKKALDLLSRKNVNFDLIFIDPPYKLYEEESVENLVALGLNLLNENGMFIIEHNKKDEIIHNLFEVKTKKYGETMISYFWRDI